jgi:predicted ATPase/DNA-binding SARP family transcriptional activator
MQVLIHGRPLPHLRSRKALWLLALLALRQDRPILREWLAGTLWPDTDQGRAFTNLRVTLSELRGALGDQSERLQSPSRHALFLDLTGVDVDLPVFDTAMRSQDLEAMKQAVALYRGSLLEGCNEEWVAQERQQREQECLQALQTLGDAALAAGNYGAAIGYYQRAVSMDPWREAARRGWMEALAKGGDRNAAMQVYRELRELLRNDPGALPDEETSALYARLRAEARQRSHAQITVPAKESGVDTADPRDVSGYLPHPLTDLVGREQERMEVAAKLRGCRLVTLTGPGGIGKTRLAIEVAEEGVQDGVLYPDGVWLVALESLSEGQQIVPQIAGVVGIREESGRSLLKRLIEHLRTRRLLLVLDNCEHLLEASAQVIGDLLRECARVRILATSREALGIIGEAVFLVPSLAAPDPNHLPAGSATALQVFADYESIQLFVQRAQERRKGFALTQHNALAIAQVCFQLDGIPLAIELAAARIHAMTVELIATRLNDHLNLLTIGNRTAHPRQKTLRATLDWSYALLSVTEQTLLARLSIFAGGATLPAVEAVCSGAGIEQSQVLDLLTSLVDKSLVLVETTQAQGRYHLLETVQLYATERLAGIKSAEAIQEKHLAWFLTFAEETEPHLRGPDQEIYQRRIYSEYANLRVALTRNARGIGKAEAGMRLSGALWWYWRTQGRFREGSEYLEAALAREGAQGKTLMRAKALNVAGELANRQGDHKAGRTLYEQGLAISRELGDRAGIAHSLHSLGDVAYARGDYEAARTQYEERLATSRELGDWQSIADSLNSLGHVAYQQGDYETTRALHTESMAISQELGDRRGVAHSLNNLGLVARDQGDYEAARMLYEQGLAIRRELGDGEEIAHSLNDLGLVAHYRGDCALAGTLYEQGLAIRRELGDRVGIAHSLYCLGTVAQALGDYDAARTLYEQGLAMNRELGDKGGIAHSLYYLGQVARDRGDNETARTLYQESLALYRETQHSFIIHVLGALGHVARELGNHDQATTLYQESLRLRREQGDALATACSLEDFAGLAGRQGQFERAVRLLGAVEVLCASLGRTLPVGVKEEYERTVAAAHAALSEEALAMAWEEGRAMTLEQAVEFALEESGEQAGYPGSLRNELGPQRSDRFPSLKRA